MENNSIITTSIFGDGYNILILLLAVVNTFFLYKAYQHIQLLKKELYTGESVLEKLISKRLGKPDAAERLGKDDFHRWEEMYREATRWYHLFTGMISVFPLLGVGGTVLGIIPAVVDFSSVQSSFALALVSTLLGVLFAIFFKFFESFLSGSYTLVSERINTLTVDVARFLFEKE
ncbi:MotA/TolQ/ExbB proton channel family protein [Chondrinema litorale]|uniref:MotA/TolQ/ExbB proton channel family protein n=1 Tax=Chondrinema litorale TaxID=2994555 RepID=UPI002543AEA2|nr:MotA/TolQ/ExbB proton channel family protein [Chondrinema litorale]UZR95446.1 MotA/TolQ/ExbB proton channel family protein [Chondrinema litorale]